MKEYIKRLCKEKKPELFYSEESLEKMDDNKELKEMFREDVINSYIKLKRQEIDDFYKEEIFDKDKPVTDWERNNTLDC